VVRSLSDTELDECCFHIKPCGCKRLAKDAAALIDRLAAEKVIANNRVTILRGRAEAAEAERDKLREALREARDDIRLLMHGADLSVEGVAESTALLARIDALPGGSHAPK
jgi:hypothetical protein